MSMVMLFTLSIGVACAGLYGSQRAFEQRLWRLGEFSPSTLEGYRYRYYQWSITFHAMFGLGLWISSISMGWLWSTMFFLAGTSLVIAKWLAKDEYLLRTFLSCNQKTTWYACHGLVFGCSVLATHPFTLAAMERGFYATLTCYFPLLANGVVVPV